MTDQDHQEMADKDKHYRIVFIGPPGAGKGTQARRLSKYINIPQISTGDILREEIRRGGDLGEKAQSYMNQGLLVPDEVILQIVGKRLHAADCKRGFILDGFPRTLNQAKALNKEIQVDYVMLFDVPDDVLFRRLSGRRVCPRCQKMYHVEFNPPKNNELCDICNVPLIRRRDDEDETIKRRIEVYKRQTIPVIKFYKRTENIEFCIIKAGDTGEDTPEKIHEKIIYKLGLAA